MSVAVVDPDIPRDYHPPVIPWPMEGSLWNDEESNWWWVYMRGEWLLYEPVSHIDKMNWHQMTSPIKVVWCLLFHWKHWQHHKDSGFCWCGRCHRQWWRARSPRKVGS